MVERGLAAGALGYVLKHTAGDELVPAVRAALRDDDVARPLGVLDPVSGAAVPVRINARRLNRV